MNLYLPIYKRLESEVIKLSYDIYFDDNQWNVYSLAISDLLLKCSVEIEALAKELYISLGGNDKLMDAVGKPRDLYFDTDCIDFLVQSWLIDQKKVQIVHPNMYFSAEKSILKPLHKSHKRGTSGSKWKQAYQAVKHNRSKSIEMATVGNLMNALAALYILNIYYSNESFWVGKPIQNRREFKIDSEIFMPAVCDATIDFAIGPYMGDSKNKKYINPTIEESIYVKKVTDKSFEDINTLFCENELRNILMVKNSKNYKDYISNHPEAKEDNLANVADAIGIDILALQKQDGRIHRAVQLIENQEAVLVKESKIYNDYSFDEYMKKISNKMLPEEFQNILDLENIAVPLVKEAKIILQ